VEWGGVVVCVCVWGGGAGQGRARQGRAGQGSKLGVETAAVQAIQAGLTLLGYKGPERLGGYLLHSM
jgi:hypothetical protein